MQKINLLADAPDGPSHPRVRDWKRRIDAGQSVSLELYRPSSALGLSQTKMYVHYTLNGAEIETDETAWEQVLNEGLIELGATAIDETNESERFALGLRDALRPIEKEFNNGYFNSVLLDLLDESNLAEDPEIAQVLKHTYHNATERNTRSYERCREALMLGILARLKELKSKLHYSADKANRILTASIAKYLDERFSVSSRRLLGLL